MKNGERLYPSTVDCGRMRTCHWRPAPVLAHEILSKIGEGGMGELYLAHDTKLNRRVAIKVLPGAYASDPDRIARAPALAFFVITTACSARFSPRTAGIADRAVNR
jgi:serine/threonine protein kinase